MVKMATICKDVRLITEEYFKKFSPTIIDLPHISNICEGVPFTEINAETWIYFSRFIKIDRVFDQTKLYSYVSYFWVRFRNL